MIKLLILIIYISISLSEVAAKESCKWNNSKGIPCVSISKIPNTSSINKNFVNRDVFTKKNIQEVDAKDSFDILRLIPGIDYYQTGQKGQTGAIFMRGSESNHTLVLLNGIPINDQSTTNGMHDFGQDFLNSFQKVEIYKGSNGAHFGPDAIGGAINFITDIDYVNSLSLSGFNNDNNSLNFNKTKISNSDWHLNLKGSLNQIGTESAKAGGKETDDTKNKQINLNATKWIRDDLKIKSTFYLRNNLSDYDKSKTQENSISSNNQMYAVQYGIEQKTENSFKNFTTHYHNYNRRYYEQGKKDKYYSESIVMRFENENIISNKISFGYGSDYKYDWGNYTTTTFESQTKGNLSNLGLFGNIGINFNQNQFLSIHTRNDDHKETGGNKTYKVSFSNQYEKFLINLSTSTGIRNPSLYELYGSSSTYNGNTKINSEKSKTNELFFEYNPLKNVEFTSTAYKTHIRERIKLNSSWNAYENKKSDTTQKGIETKISFKGKKQKLSFVTHFAKSRTDTGGPNSRRPDFSYGIDYFKKIRFKNLGEYNLNANLRHIGKHLDWTGSKNEFVKSVNLIDLSFGKKIYKKNFKFKISNLLNEDYEKPATYSQDGRQINFLFSIDY